MDMARGVSPIMGRRTAAFIILFLTAGCATSADIQPVATAPTIQISKEETAKAIHFDKIVIAVPEGTDMGALQSGILCGPHREFIYTGGRKTIVGEDLSRAFKNELESANYRVVVDDPDAIFGDAAVWQAEYRIAGIVEHMLANICFPYLGWGDADSASGEALMRVNWKLFSRVEGQIVYETTTEGAASISNALPNGAANIFAMAFSQAVRNLLGDQRFHGLMTGKVKVAEDVRLAGEIAVSLAPRSDRPILERMDSVRRNVVTIKAGDRLGSGFIIDRAGYLLTNEHVVRGQDTVILKFTGGAEATARVLATNFDRDVALLVAAGAGGEGLPLRFNLPEVGSDVYAVGTHAAGELDLAMTRGIVSAHRSIGGRAYILSDVNVFPGNSGGPLLDSRGNVLGVSVMFTTLPGGAPAGMNLFIPIEDALQQMGISTTD